jgi:ABC-type glycerol-3-phosphate transport system substrate-binding protein
MSPVPTPLSRRTLLLGSLGTALAGGLGLSGCSSDSGGGSGLQITLAGPNQWNSDGASFGKPWEDLIARFQAAEPDISIKTVVLPLKEFKQTLATQLSAGSAPELVFSQAAHEPHMIHPLTEALKQPNPYVSGNKAWLDLFDPKYFAPGLPNVVSATSGDFEFIPFNLVAVGVYYNTEAFTKAGVKAPIATFADLLEACEKLTAAGYTPFAMDNSDLGVGWTVKTIANMMLDKYFDKINTYDAAGKTGKAQYLSPKAKSWARAVLTGEISAKGTPEVAETLKLLKQFFDAGVTKNWSGVASSSGSVVNLRDFQAGKAAMAWGVPFGYGALGELQGKVSSMPFPTITAASSPLSTGAPARFGTSVGGTSYMIPSTLDEKHREAAIKFLQWMSVPANVQPWLDATGGVPAVKGATVPPGVAGMISGTWSEPMRMGGLPGGPAGTTELSLYDGYLLGTKSLDQELDHLQDLWIKGTRELVKKNGWDKEDWAKA